MVSEAIAPGTGCTCRRSGRSATRWSWSTLAVRAETAGWDGVFLWDHLVHEGMPIADPRTTQAAIAQATAQLRLGPMGALAGAGMTWRMESLIHFDPLELSLEIVDAGPPR